MKFAAIVRGAVMAIAVAVPVASAAVAQEQGSEPSLPKPPADYVVGAGDVLGVVFWRERELTADVVVRPDGKISLPLMNDVEVAGLTPDQVRERVVGRAKEFVEDPNATVIVKQINSRWVYVTGQVGKPGPYPLTGPTTVLQLIATAGGVLEYADTKNIIVMRNENGKPSYFRFNYKDVVRQRNLKQNIALKPGDTVVVPHLGCLQLGVRVSLTRLGVRPQVVPEEQVVALPPATGRADVHVDVPRPSGLGTEVPMQ